MTKSRSSNVQKARQLTEYIDIWIAKCSAPSIAGDIPESDERWSVIQALCDLADSHNINSDPLYRLGHYFDSYGLPLMLPPGRALFSHPFIGAHECLEKLKTALSLKTTSKIQTESGPGSDGEFYWNGNPLKLQPLDCRLLVYLWKNRRASLQAIIDAVWEGQDDKEGAVKNSKNRVARVLLNASAGITITQKDGHLLLERLKETGSK